MKIVIIGGNGAGMTCAAKLQRNLPKAEIVVFENSPYVSFGACGLPYYIGNFFSNSNNLFARTKEQLEATGFKIFTEHEVLNINPKTKTLEVKNLQKQTTFTTNYNKLVLATGANAITLNLQGENISTVKTLAEADKIKNYLKKHKVKNIGILGAGYIGLELLEAFTNYNINIIDLKSQLSQNFLDSEFEEVLAKEINSHSNIKLHLNTAFKELTNNQKNLTLHLINNQTQKPFEIKVEFLIVALGFKPFIPEILHSKIKTLPNGAVLINQKGETSIKDIYAAGDCASIWHNILKTQTYIPLATVANKMGKKVADTIAKHSNSFTGVLGSACLKLLNLEIAKTGISESEAKANNIPYVATFVKDYNHTNYYPNQAKLFMKILHSPKTKKILGAQLVGKNGTSLRLHALSVAIEAGLTIDKLGNLDFAYAPPFNRTWEALNVLGNVAAKAKTSS